MRRANRMRPQRRMWPSRTHGPHAAALLAGPAHTESHIWFVYAGRPALRSRAQCRHAHRAGRLAPPRDETPWENQLVTVLQRVRVSKNAGRIGKLPLAWPRLLRNCKMDALSRSRGGADRGPRARP